MFVMKRKTLFFCCWVTPRAAPISMHATAAFSPLSSGKRAPLGHKWTLSALCYPSTKEFDVTPRSDPFRRQSAVHTSFVGPRRYPLSPPSVGMPRRARLPCVTRPLRVEVRDPWETALSTLIFVGPLGKRHPHGHSSVGIPGIHVCLVAPFHQDFDVTPRSDT